MVAALLSKEGYAASIQTPFVVLTRYALCGLKADIELGALTLLGRSLFLELESSNIFIYRHCCRFIEL